MFIFWGRKLVRRLLGYVADFCGVCRAKRAFKLQRVGSVAHVYYLSFGEGQLVGYERTCCDCGTVTGANAAAYASIAKSLGPLQELKQATYPNLDTVIAERLDLEERIKKAPKSLSVAERDALIKSPFLLLSPKVEKRFSSTHIDWGVGMALVGTIGLLVVAPSVGSFILPDSPEKIFVIALAIGAALIIWQGVASGPRYIRKEVLPMLSKSLSPLEPTEQEIERSLNDLKLLGHKIAKKVKASELIACVHSAQTA